MQIVEPPLAGKLNYTEKETRILQTTRNDFLATMQWILIIGIEMLQRWRNKGNIFEEIIGLFIFAKPIQSESRGLSTPVRMEIDGRWRFIAGIQNVSNLDGTTRNILLKEKNSRNCG